MMPLDLFGFPPLCVDDKEFRKLAVHAPGDGFPLERGPEGRHLWTCLSTKFARGDHDDDADDDEEDEGEDDEEEQHEGNGDEEDE